MTYNPIYNCVVSVDNGGMIEYWEPSGDFQKPMDLFEFKSKTDLYDFKKVSFQTETTLTFRRNPFLQQ
jgi:peptidylprolyl isomerase domain and WD repeat-containing protein 1